MTRFLFGGPRPPTHQTIPPERLLRLASFLEDAVEDSEGDLITAELLEDLAAERGVDASHLLAAACATDLEFEAGAEITFRLCTGGCQAWGALERAQELLDLGEKRRQDGKSSFNVLPRQCLERCMVGPVLEVHTPDGVAVIERATNEMLSEAVEQLCD